MGQAIFSEAQGGSFPFFLFFFLEVGSPPFSCSSSVSSLCSLQGTLAQPQPWWKIQLFMWEPVLFGTWDGVFTSCMINIFGVVLFLRTGWLVVSDDLVTLEGL